MATRVARSYLHFTFILRRHWHLNYNEKTTHRWIRMNWMSESLANVPYLCSIFDYKFAANDVNWRWIIYNFHSSIAHQVERYRATKWVPSATVEYTPHTHLPADRWLPNCISNGMKMKNAEEDVLLLIHFYIEIHV